MKKLCTTLFVAVLFYSVSFAALSGTYYIGATPGSRPGGGDPEFAQIGKSI